ncbi:MAG TPA: altronate dehydratase family protein [Rhodothermales bacterium]|nr:altronate dehydratase family protein [Rhodothermales bacterium]
MALALKVHATDNVLVALRDLPVGAEVHVNGDSLVLPQRVRAKHKIATHALAPGDPITMYGVLVGKAAESIDRGAPLTTKNVTHAAEAFGLRRGAYDWSAPDVTRWQGRTFMGYHRADGQVGTANHWLVLPLVFCENRNVEALKEAFEKELGYARPGLYQRQVAELVSRYQQGASAEELLRLHLPKEKPSASGHRVFPHVEGIRFLTHEGGCGGTRQDARTLCGLLAGYIHHPNVAGATVLSLGCQNAQVAILQEEIQCRNPNFDKPLLVFEQQQHASEYEMLSDAIRQTFVGLTEANQLERKPAPLSNLTIGVECGGSDGFSGISANPAIGHVADLVVALGGSVILSEFPELCGVEQELIDRCVYDEVAKRFQDLMRAYAARAEAVGSGFDMNPSPGNIKDGLITDAMKSAGAAKKGGTSPVVAVLDYPEYATAPGLNLLCTPGNDVESTTGMAGSGANVMLFSTGLGTPTGNPVAPVVKVSSNTDLATRLPDLIDFDAGPIITGEQTIAEAGEELLELVIQVASGEIVPRAVQLGQHDFIPWKRGVSL